MYIAKITSPSYSFITTKPASNRTQSTNSSDSHGLWREDLHETAQTQQQTPFLSMLEQMQNALPMNELLEQYQRSSHQTQQIQPVEHHVRNQERLQAYQALDRTAMSGTRIAITS